MNIYKPSRKVRGLIFVCNAECPWLKVMVEVLKIYYGVRVLYGYGLGKHLRKLASVYEFLTIPVIRLWFCFFLKMSAYWLDTFINHLVVTLFQNYNLFKLSVWLESHTFSNPPVSFNIPTLDLQATVFKRSTTSFRYHNSIASFWCRKSFKGLDNAFRLSRKHFWILICPFVHPTSLKSRLPSSAQPNQSLFSP